MLPQRCKCHAGCRSEPLLVVRSHLEVPKEPHFFCVCVCVRKHLGLAMLNMIVWAEAIRIEQDGLPRLHAESPSCHPEREGVWRLCSRRDELLQPDVGRICAGFPLPAPIAPSAACGLPLSQDLITLTSGPFWHFVPMIKGISRDAPWHSKSCHGTGPRARQALKQFNPVHHVKLRIQLRRVTCVSTTLCRSTWVQAWLSRAAWPACWSTFISFTTLCRQRRQGLGACG